MVIFSQTHLVTLFRSFLHMCVGNDVDKDGCAYLEKISFYFLILCSAQPFRLLSQESLASSLAKDEKKVSITERASLART
jgi:hypothetical protein